MKNTTTKCPFCNKPGGDVKVVSDLGDGTGRIGRPGYRDQRAQTKRWHQSCLDEFEAINKASRERFLRETEEQMQAALAALAR